MQSVSYGGLRPGTCSFMRWVQWMLLLSAFLATSARSERTAARTPATGSAIVTVEQVVGETIVPNPQPGPQAFQLALPNRSPARELQQGKQQGFCSLSIQGHGSGKIGIARASLSCQGYSADIPICVNMTHLGKFVSGFKGVEVLKKLPCHQDALGPQPWNGLLSFSDSRPGVVRLVDPVIRDVWLAPTIPTEAGAMLPEFLNVITIAGNSRLEIEEGTFENNFGGSVIRVTDSATVILHDTSCSHNRAYLSPCLHLTRNASVSITGQSRFSENSAVWLGGSVLAGNEAKLQVKDTSVLLKNRAGQFGGALACIEQAKCTFTGASSVVNNSAVWQALPVASSGPTNIGGTTEEKAAIPQQVESRGGGIYAEDSAMVALFEEAAVVGNVAGSFGGAIAVTELTELVVGDSALIAGNEAANSGGGVYASGQARIVLANSSTVERNNASLSGGGITIAHQAQLLVKDGSALVHNRAGQFGGALFCADKAKCTFTGASSVVNNSAVWHTLPMAFSGPTNIGGSTDTKAPEEIQSRGGGIHAEDWAVVELSEQAAVLGNMANAYGGGIALMDLAALVVDGASIAGNEADKSGGGVHASGQTRILLANSSRVEKNSAQLYGGGILVVEQANFTCQSGSVLLANSAVEMGGGGVAAVGAMGGGTSAGCVSLLDGCAIMENTCQSSGCDGGGLFIAGGTSLFVSGVSATTVGRGANHAVIVKGNRGSLGAGIRASGTWGRVSITVNGSVRIADNQGDQGGGMMLYGNVSLTVPSSGVQVVNNSAAESGGGLWLAEFTGSVNTLPNLVGSVHDNKAGSGHDLYVDPTQFVLISPPVVESVSRVRNDEGGVVVLAKLTGYGGLPSPNCTVNGVLRQEGGKNWDSLGNFLSNGTGVIAMNLKLKRPPGTYAVSFRVWENADLQTNITLRIRGCHIGEVGNHAGDVCEVCPVGSYSLDSKNITCDPCPPGAYCPGGALVLPTPGFWHSAGESTQFHRWVLAAPDTELFVPIFINDASYSLPSLTQPLGGFMCRCQSFY